MAGLNRRDFLKLVGLTGSSAVIGCSSKIAEQSRLIPYLFPPEDITPGIAAWYATTCRECPAGCGVLAKNREGRVIKVEGNPLHPVNQGKLCARGQAAVQGIYNPDRIRGPMRKNSRGQFEPISWEQAEALFVEKLQQLKKTGTGSQAVFLTSLITGSLRDLTIRWLSDIGSEKFLTYEPLAHEPLRKANQTVFDIDAIPAYRIDKADFLISFGADFLETWISPVEYARQFALFHEPRDSGKNSFVFVGPRQSLTAASADRWAGVPPGTEYLVALGMLRIILEKKLCAALPSAHAAALLAAVNGFSLETITATTGIDREMLSILARRFASAQKPLALAGNTGPHPTATAVAANLLCCAVPGTCETIDFEHPSALSEAMCARDVQTLGEKMAHNEVSLLMISNANPVFSTPPAWEFAKAVAAVPFVVSFSSTLDETSSLAHLVLPAPTPLESWGDYTPRAGTTGLMQPVMGSMFKTRHPGDVFISTGKKLGRPERFPWLDYYHLLRESWQNNKLSLSGAAPDEKFWDESMQKGGAWKAEDFKPAPLPLKFSPFSFPAPHAAPAAKSLQFIAYPTIQFFDGRSANRPWLQELPDPLTMITWGSWLEINPETAARLGIAAGDLLQVQSPFGSLEVPAYPYHGVHPDTVAMPMGQGHTVYGQFADSQPGNPVHLLSPDLEKPSGAMLWSVSGIALRKQGREIPLANTDGSLSQHNRELAQAVSWENLARARAAGKKPHLHLPLPEGYDPAIDFYAPHEHSEHRWCMAVDLDRCIGCGACVVACSAENNVAVVGREQVIRGREMSWLRVQRYFEVEHPAPRFLPMLCQHCDSAPCESVCPVYAPHHSAEGLNNQIYNRCIGTRFCSQNCPYKVRRFNFFTYARPEPLNWQLNPDVTVRERGVMEKCSFCVQRIKEVKNIARDENRKIKDNEIKPA